MLLFKAFFVLSTLRRERQPDIGIGGHLGKDNMTCACGALASSPCMEAWGTLAGQEWLRKVPLGAKSPSPISSLPAKNSLSHYHASDTEHHRSMHLARVSTQETELCRGVGAGHTDVQYEETQACTLANWCDTVETVKVYANVQGHVLGLWGHY